MDYIKECEWADFSVSIEGKRVTGIQGISYKETDEDELLYAQGRDPIGLQTGNTTYEGELKLLKNEVDALNLAAKAAGYRSVKDVPNLVLTAVYMPKGQRQLRTDIIMGAKISELTYGWDQGAKYMPITLPFKYMTIKRA